MRHQITQWGHEAWVGPDGVHFSDYGSLEELARTAPHDCDVPGCPGPLNQRKLERYQELMAACLDMTNLLQATIVKYVGNGTILTDAEWNRVGQARAAIAIGKRAPATAIGAHEPGCQCPRANCTLARLGPPLNDPEIHEALKDVGLS